MAEQEAISHSHFSLYPFHPPSQLWCIYRAKGQQFKSRMVRVQVGSLPTRSFSSSLSLASKSSPSLVPARPPRSSVQEGPFSPPFCPLVAVLGSQSSCPTQRAFGIPHEGAERERLGASCTPGILGRWRLCQSHHGDICTLSNIFTMPIRGGQTM